MEIINLYFLQVRHHHLFNQYFQNNLGQTAFSSWVSVISFLKKKTGERGSSEMSDHGDKGSKAMVNCGH